MKQDQREGIVSSTFVTSKICTITKKNKGQFIFFPPRYPPPGVGWVGNIQNKVLGNQQFEDKKFQTFMFSAGAFMIER